MKIFKGIEKCCFYKHNGNWAKAMDIGVKNLWQLSGAFSKNMYVC
jgi:hypothetical protein